MQIVAQRFGGRRPPQHESRLEFLGLVQAEGPPKEDSVPRPEHGVDLRRRPHVIDAFNAVGLRVERGDKSAARIRHLFEHEGEGSLGRAAVFLLACAVVDLRKELGQLRLVVKHLLEVRNVPAAVGAVAMETACQVIDDASRRNVIERVGHHGVGLLIVGMRGRKLEQLELGRLGKLGGIGFVRIEVDAAELGIARLDQRLDGRRHQPALELHRRRVETRPRQPPHRAGDQLGVLFDAGAVALPGVQHAGKHSREPGLARPILGGKKVPPANGLPSGVRNIERGQPPESPEPTACA